MKKIFLILGTALILMSPEAGAQQTLTLDDCRQMAVRSSRDLEQARTAIEMAGYDKKIALANYFPNLSATGTYQYNSRNISLVSDSQSAALQGLGDRAQGILDQAWSETAAQLGESAQAARAQLEQTIRDNPLLALEYTLSPMWKTVFGMLSEADLSSLKAPQIAEPVNAIGKELDEALHLDNKNLYAGVISIQQPLFVGGKIIYSNQMAALAEELEEARYDQAYADILVDVDEAYWQIVSIAGKKKLAEAYADLLHTLESDVQKSVEAGVMTEADALQIKVKANEADLLRTKAGNGLTLAKMLLCKRVGLPLDSQVTLADEGADLIPQPQDPAYKDFDSICADRPETRSLQLASEIYDRKAKVARADMLPKVILTANYLITNPNVYNGFQKRFSGVWNVGVTVQMPVWNWFEGRYKIRASRAATSMARMELSDVQEKINLQVTQSRFKVKEARKRLTMANNNVKSAEENLRCAQIGFREGVIPSTDVMAAQTAWQKAHSDKIDAEVDLRVSEVNLEKALGILE